MATDRIRLIDRIDRTAIVEAIIVLMVAISLVISITALSKANSNETAIINLQEDIVKTHKEIGKRFDSIDAHLMLLEKYARAEYYHFYGDVKNFEPKDNSKSKTTNR